VSGFVPNRRGSGEYFSVPGGRFNVRADHRHLAPRPREPDGQDRRGLRHRESALAQRPGNRMGFRHCLCGKTLSPGDSVAIQGSLEIESKAGRLTGLFVVALQVMALRKRSVNRLPVGSTLRAAAL
jgi:hypothetical protein